MDADLCELCGGELKPLGVLVDLMHYQCRDCGISCSEPLAEDEEE